MAYEAWLARGKPEDLDQPTWARRRRERLGQLVEPPEFASLGDRPGLQAAARSAFVDGCHWADARVSALRPPARGPLFSWRATKEVAEEVAAELGVSIGAVQG